MASPTTNSDLTQALEEAAQHLRTLAAEADRQQRAAADRLRRWTERMNQALRRMRQATDADAWGQVVAEASGVAYAAVFRQQGAALKLVGLHGDSSPTVAAALREKGLATKAPALASLLETQDTVVALRSGSEVSNELIELFPQCTSAKAHLIPLAAKRQVTGLLYLLGADQTVDVNAVELLAAIAEASWQDRVEPAKTVSPSLLQIAPVKEAKRPWEQLTPAERDLHLRAQNFARSSVSRLLLRQHDAVLTGREMGNLYQAFQKSLEEDRRTYRERFMQAQPSMVDYLHVELVRTLAEGNEALLGTEYPGPLA